MLTRVEELQEQMAEIPAAEFFATIGQMNVHPSPVGRYDQETGYLTHWKTPSGQIVAQSIGGTECCEARYFVPR